MIRPVFITVVFCFALCSAAVAQVCGCASDEARRLSFLEGEWKLQIKYRLGRDSDQWDESRSDAKIKFLFRDCLIEERVTGTRQGRAFSAVAMYGYNAALKKYEWLFTDSEHGVLSVYHGDLVSDGLILQTGVETPVGKVLLRRILKLNGKVIEGRTERSPDHGKTWTPTSYFSYSK